MKQQKTKPTWKKVFLGEILDYEQPTKYIVESTDYKDEYKTPVLTAGKSFILGYTNETEGIYDKLPVIIFDDFTTENKFVDFKFKVKSSAMKLLTPKNDLIDLKYVFLAMQKINFDRQRHKRYYLSAYQFLKIPLPFIPEGKPDLETQKQIVAVLEKSEKLKQKQKRQLELYDEYTKSVFWEMFLKKDFEKIEINQGILKTENKIPEKDFPEEYFNYVDIASIDNQSKIIFETKKILGKDAPSRAKQLIKFKDVLISTVRPNLNAVALVPKNLDNQICSTGYCILRADNKKFISEYLFFVSQSIFFINELVGKTQGANYPAVSNNNVKSVKIPLPPLKLQEKFAEIVEKVEKLKEKQKKALADAEELFNVLMQKAFRGELE